VAVLFWKHFKPSPFHFEDSKVLRPAFTSLLKAFKNLNLPTKRQKAITPQFL
jgi:hypothetical protein